MQRRSWLAQVPAFAAGIGIAACGGGQAAEDGSPIFVFVHGAWHGSACWAPVVQALAQRGFRSLALDLPGHGMEARFPASYASQNLAQLATEVSPLAGVGLVAYRDRVIAAIRGLVNAGRGPVILVGHSLGGATCTMVGEAAPELIHRLVYLTAFAPVRFDTVYAYLQQPSFSSSQVGQLFVGDPTVTGALRINHDAADPAYVELSRSVFYTDVTPTAFQAAANLLTPDEPLQCFIDPVRPTAARWGSVPRAYIRCTLDQGFPLAAQDQMIAEADAFTPANKFVQRSIASSHSPFISRPDELAQLLISI